MSNQPIEDLLPKADWSVYRLVRMVANRTAELSDGRPSLIKHSKEDKLTSVAMAEVAQGKVVFKDVADQFTPADDNGGFENNLSEEDEK